MIFDDFKNFDLYNISPEIKNFILNLDPNIKARRYEISKNAYINIDEYQTKDIKEIKLEAHRKYIDIQFLIDGVERIYTTDIKGLEVLEKYDENKDVEFYQTPKRPLNLSYLTKNKFILLYPDDAHSPCINFDNTSLKVKKAVVKIKI